MTFGQAVISAFSKYATFRGRAGRSEFWFFQLFCILLGIGIAVLDTATGNIIPEAGWSAGTLLPGLALAVRRLHDRGRSGWWLLLLLLPIVGVIPLIVWWCRPTVQGPNRYDGALRSDRRIGTAGLTA